MKIQMRTNYAGPDFSAWAGEIIQVEESYGRELIATGAATEFLGAADNLIPIADKRWTLKTLPKPVYTERTQPWTEDEIHTGRLSRT